MSELLEETDARDYIFAPCNMFRGDEYCLNWERIEQIRELEDEEQFLLDKLYHCSLYEADEAERISNQIEDLRRRKENIRRRL